MKLLVSPLSRRENWCFAGAGDFEQLFLTERLAAWPVNASPDTQIPALIRSPCPPSPLPGGKVKGWVAALKSISDPLPAFSGLIDSLQ